MRNAAARSFVFVLFGLACCTAPRDLNVCMYMYVCMYYLTSKNI